MLPTKKSGNYKQFSKKKRDANPRVTQILKLSGKDFEEAFIAILRGINVNTLISQ